MYQKRNRIYDRLASDRESGAFDLGTWDFVTTTLRPSLVAIPDAYQWIKPAMAYAIRKVRQARNGPGYAGRGRRWARHAWPGVHIEYMNDVDVQPGTQMPHIHALYFVRQSGAYLPSRKAIARELHYYLNAFLYRKLQRSPLRWEVGKRYPYCNRKSLAYVHFSEARSTENCAMYMALHNGKIWTDGREYPPKYRRFATSRGFLPRVGEYETVTVRKPVKGLPVEEWPLVQRSQRVKKESGWQFVQRSVSDLAVRLAEQGVVLEVEPGPEEQVLSFSVREEMTSGRVRWAIGTASPEQERSAPSGCQLAEDVAEKMRRLQAYWASEADLQGLSFEAWEQGGVAPSLAETIGETVGNADGDPFWEPDFERLSALSRRWPRCTTEELRHNLAYLDRHGEFA